MSQTTSWQHLWDQAQPAFSHAEQSLERTRSPASRILRVGQLDAELLDVELVNLLRDPLSKALGLVNVRNFLLFSFKATRFFLNTCICLHLPTNPRPTPRVRMCMPVYSQVPFRARVVTIHAADAVQTLGLGDRRVLRC
jgi:hypothetical protein